MYGCNVESRVLNASDTHTRTHGQAHKRFTVCKQGTNPNNVAHKVELKFSLQSKRWFPSQQLGLHKGPL